MDLYELYSKVEVVSNKAKADAPRNTNDKKQEREAKKAQVHGALSFIGASCSKSTRKDMLSPFIKGVVRSIKESVWPTLIVVSSVVVLDVR